MNLLTYEDLYEVMNPDCLTESNDATDEVFLTEDEALEVDYLNSLYENENIRQYVDYLSDYSEEDVDTVFEYVEYLQEYVSDVAEFDNEYQLNEAILLMNVDTIVDIFEDIVTEEGLYESSIQDINSTITTILENDLISEGVDNDTLDESIIIDRLKIAYSLLEANIVKRAIGGVKQFGKDIRSGREKYGADKAKGLASIAKTAAGDIAGTAKFIDRMRSKKSETPTKSKPKATESPKTGFSPMKSYKKPSDSSSSIGNDPNVSLYSKKGGFKAVSNKKGKQLYGGAAKRYSKTNFSQLSRNVHTKKLKESSDDLPSLGDLFKGSDKVGDKYLSALEKRKRDRQLKADFNAIKKMSSNKKS